MPTRHTRSFSLALTAAPLLCRLGQIRVSARLWSFPPTSEPYRLSAQRLELAVATRHAAQRFPHERTPSLGQQTTRENLINQPYVKIKLPLTIPQDAPGTSQQLAQMPLSQTFQRTPSELYDEDSKIESYVRSKTSRRHPAAPFPKQTRSLPSSLCANVLSPPNALAQPRAPKPHARHPPRLALPLR